MLPLRDPACASFLVGAMFLVSFAVLARLRVQMLALGTIEVCIVRLIARVPVFIMVARCAYLYDESALSVAGCGLLGYVTVRQMAISAARYPGRRPARAVLGPAPVHRHLLHRCIRGGRALCAGCRFSHHIVSGCSVAWSVLLARYFSQSKRSIWAAARRPVFRLAAVVQPLLKRVQTVVAERLEGAVIL